MDAGAHFHCCDLQIHTPRDNDWVGDCPVTHDQRQSYAEEFISACRQKVLDAVAITDHHDLAFFPYIRDAAHAEVDSTGQAIPRSKQIAVFPGLELTLATPCQALLLFDPDVSELDLGRAMAAIGITAAASSEPKGMPVERLTILHLNDIYARLEQHDGLRGRFIVLPNLNDGGSDSLLRPGFFEHYKTMACVGGYVDGSCSGHGKRQIVDGKDTAWGNKRVGLLQTSDSRQRDFSRLGTHPTWIKWSAPTTEALRQACLAPDSRIRYEPPLLPDNYISRIEVTDSKYFGPFSVEFNSQLNTIIGGRGSGKSTILEYVRWALSDQPYVHHEDEDTELPDFEKRRRSLIGGTLRQRSGSVLVDYVRNGVHHRIRREGATGKLYLKVADQPEVEATEETVQSLAQIQGYSQKQLSHVSVRAQELIRLLKSPIAQDLAMNKSQLDASASDLRQVFERYESRRSLLSQLTAIDVDLASKREQIEALTREVRDLPEEQRNDISAHPAFMEGQRLATSYSTAISSGSAIIGTADSGIRKLITELAPVATARPDAPLNSIRERTEQTLRNALQNLDAINVFLSNLRNELASSFQQVQDAVTAHNTRYQAAASENTIIQQHLESLRTLSGQTTAIDTQRTEIARKLAEIGDPETQMQLARSRWRDAVESELSLLERQASQLTSDTNGDLRVRIDRSRNLDTLKRSLQDSIKGAAITTPEKFDSLARNVSESSDPVAAWIELGQGLVSMARVGPQLSMGVELPVTPKLAAAGFIPSELRRIASKLNPISAFQLTLLYPENVPVFEYKTQGGSYIPFEEASPGQQATALIGLLLSQTAGPLVVDQPEDDLDMSTILTVAGRLWGAKEKRQVIFTTHNPNLVVIGDAELVLNCAYTQPGQASKVHIAGEGAIDNPEICSVITSVMEGGEQAFRLRKERYGF